ncbi:deoxyhypusine synthase [Dorcoceras hygrometricum]|uniref:Deoxyhypusine synthase n=1 Tax=Dorcoceras hygrometricum TaxID=472368 RepID=A0A2Z7BX35_9LAMI|nr:deoxyhypusine synthase [Dorcoceras hygrometricum]
MGVGENLMESAHEAAFKSSVSLDGSSPKIEGYDFNNGVNYHALLKCMASTGFQASNLGDAIQIVNEMVCRFSVILFWEILLFPKLYISPLISRMMVDYASAWLLLFLLWLKLDWRLSDESPTEDCSEEEKSLAFRESVKCKVFLGFTSNLISSGVRDIIRYLLQHHMVDVVVTTAGGIEEDLVKCLSPTYKGDFDLPGAVLRSKGLNRIGNLLVPNDNYCKFEDWIIPIFDRMLHEQNLQNIIWTPSKVIARLGKEINDESSYLYWAYKNNIPVFCPGLTDGSLGDMLYFHSFKSDPGLVIDIVQDIRAMNGEAVHAGLRKTGIIILGGGLPKHHICNANMMRNGADFAIFINTAQEYDGSDSGARPDEAVSWGKIRVEVVNENWHSAG